MSRYYPSAYILADSVNASTGDRLTTMVLNYQRFIHSELLTHRMLSKNSSSSRAIPFEKMLKKVLVENVEPLHYGKNQRGMSALVEVDPLDRCEAQKVWFDARDKAIEQAQKLHKLGIHKQVVNRLLEPFSSITVIVSATEWQNFFNQRSHPDAQPEIKALSDEMKAAYENSEPKKLNPGEWHLPFIKDDDLRFGLDLETARKISTGRCARVSYLNHDGEINIQADRDLHDKLISSNPPHLSPFEHQAIALVNSDRVGNFTGWKQYRKILEEQRLVASL